MSLALLPLSMRRGWDALSPSYVLQPPVGWALTGSALPVGKAERGHSGPQGQGDRDDASWTGSCGCS